MMNKFSWQRWQTKPLGEVCDVKDGTHDSPKYLEQGGYPFITSKNLKNGEISFENINYISKIDFDKINERSKVEKGDVLFAMIGTIGNPVVINDENPNFAIKNVALFKKSENISPYFLKYLLSSNLILEKMQNEANGSNQKFVSLKYLRAFQIPLPNSKEQERIVGILDEAFAGIDVLRQNAVSNLNNAKELFDSYLDQTFTQNTETWQLQPLKNLASIKDGDWIEKKDQSPSGIRLIQTGNVGNGFFKDKFENARYISENTFKELNCTEIFPDDCLISRLPDPVGRACIVPNLNTKMITAVDCSIVKFDLSKINPKFFIYYAMSAKYYAKIKSLTTGSTRERISRKNLETITIPLPNLKAQEQIVSNLNIIHEQSKELQSVYERKITLLDELKQSLLQKAFRGEL